MINSKNELINKLKNNINSVVFITRENEERSSYQLGVKRNCVYLQSNALRLYNPDTGKMPWIYLNEVNVKDNMLTYKNFKIVIELLEVE